MSDCHFLIFQPRAAWSEKLLRGSPLSDMLSQKPPWRMAQSTFPDLMTFIVLLWNRPKLICCTSAASGEQNLLYRHPTACQSKGREIWPIEMPVCSWEDLIARRIIFWMILSNFVQSLWETKYKIEIFLFCWLCLGFVPCGDKIKIQNPFFCFTKFVRPSRDKNLTYICLAFFPDKV